MSAPSYRVIPKEQRAVWSTAYINDLPDSSFAVIEEGGEKDAEGKTLPRNLRHLPYKDKDGKVDLPHLRNALARLPQSNLSPALKAKAQAKLNAAAKAAGVGDRSVAPVQRQGISLPADGVVRTVTLEPDPTLKPLPPAPADDTQRGVTTFKIPPAPQTVQSSLPLPPLSADGIYRVAIPATIRIVDEAKREIEVCATSERTDSYNTGFSYEASKDAFSRWIGNVREMHQPIAAGSGLEVRCDDVTRKIYVRLFISKGAESTWLKVKDGTLKGASIGASNVKWETQRWQGADRMVATQYDLVELSLVDNPSNLDALGVTFIRSGQPDMTLLAAVSEDQRMPEHPAAAPVAAPEPPSNPLAPLLAQTAAEQTRRAQQAEEARQIRIAGDKADRQFPAWDKSEDFNSYLARKQQNRGWAEQDKRTELRAAREAEEQRLAQAEAQRVSPPGTFFPAQGATPTPAVVPSVAETPRVDMVSAPVSAEDEPAADETHLDDHGIMAHAHRHSHPDGTTHSHMHLHSASHHSGEHRSAAPHAEHSHIFRQGQPFDSRLSEAEIARCLHSDETRAAFGNDDDPDMTSLKNPKSGSVFSPNDKASTPLQTVNPQKVGQRDLINSEDANALDFGVPEPAEERPTPENFELDPADFHEGGHEMQVPWTDGALDNDGDDDADDEDMPRTASEPPAPSKILTGKATPGNDDGRAVHPQTTRKGASINATNRAKLHALRDDNLKNAANSMDICDCEDCQGLAMALAALLGEADPDAQSGRALVATVTRQQATLFAQMQQQWQQTVTAFRQQIADLELTIQDANRQTQAQVTRAAAGQSQTYTEALNQIVQRVEAAAANSVAGLEGRVAHLEAQPLPGGPAAGIVEKRMVLQPQGGAEQSIEQRIALLQQEALHSNDTQFRAQIAGRILELQQQAKGQPLKPLPNLGKR